jgi:hypothetical protein
LSLEGDSSASDRGAEHQSFAGKARQASLEQAIALSALLESKHPEPNVSDSPMFASSNFINLGSLRQNAERSQS